MEQQSFLKVSLLTMRNRAFEAEVKEWLHYRNCYILFFDGDLKKIYRGVRSGRGYPLLR